MATAAAFSDLRVWVVGLNIFRLRIWLGSANRWLDFILQGSKDSRAKARGSWHLYRVWWFKWCFLLLGFYRASMGVMSIGVI